MVALDLVLRIFPVMAQTETSHIEMHAPAQSWTTSISSTVGVLVGTAKEFVYSGSYKVSELDWSLSPVAYYGSRLTVGGQSGFAAFIEIKSGFSGLSGYITDSDYLNGDGVKTHFSKHDCYTERAVSLDVRAGWPAITTSHVVVSILGVVAALDYKWSARDGYLQYPPTGETSPNYTPWSESTAKTPVVGTGIIYEQAYFALGVMLDARLKFSDVMNGTLGFGFSPIAVCRDVDNHLFTGVDYYETMSGGYLVHTEASMEIRLTSNIHLTFGGSYRLIQGLIGDTKVVYTSAPIQDPDNKRPAPGSTYSYINSAGASLSVFDLNMKLMFNL